MGRIVKRPAGYNPGWSYHLDPSTIELFEQAIEVCDGNPRYIEEHLDEVCGALLPGCTWCPCSSHISAEVATSARAYLPALLADDVLFIPPVRVVDGPVEPNDGLDERFEIARATVQADRLHVNVRIRGFCPVPEIALVASSLFLESQPVQADLLLRLEGGDDACDNDIHERTLDLELDWPYLWLSDSNRLRLIDIREPAHPRELERRDLPSAIVAMTLHRGMLWVATAEAGLLGYRVGR
jgi:hypothetical protein